MNTHRDTCLAQYSRGELVYRVLQEGATVKYVAAPVGISPTVAHEWIARFWTEGLMHFRTNPSDPHSPHSRIPAQTLGGTVVEEVAQCAAVE